MFVGSNRQLDSPNTCSFCHLRPQCVPGCSGQPQGGALAACRSNTLDEALTFYRFYQHKEVLNAVTVLVKWAAPGH